ncbi:MAG TPA: hypothetical protein VEZ14_07035 [Dehalococcoidia bacterium]|nr:hypothetical protein [Dehalococcoidia bacterium]
MSGISGITTATPLAHLTFTAPTTAGVTYFHLITGGTYTSNADGTVAANTFSCGPLPPYPTGNCGPLPNPPFPLGTTATDTSVTFSDCPIARADLNGDGIVTIGDFGLEALYFGQALPPAPSRDDQSRPRDNMITIGDFGMMATVFGKNTGSCP